MSYICQKCLKEFSKKTHHKKHTSLCQLIYNVKPANDVKTFIDLCCGIGGFHQALKNMGFKCVMASDINKDCRDNYELNYNIKPMGDLTKLDIKNIPKHNILCAGFPCQPFSKAGVQQGFKDSRGNVFFSICKIIEHHKPEIGRAHV